jgi:protoporphyrinogen oxidase
MARAQSRSRAPSTVASMTTPGAADHRVVIIGAGPAGLTAARELTAMGRRPLVLERASTVGGLARTETFKGFSFDMGGHRFFTKVEEVNKIWRDVLGRDFLRRPRLSRIYYDRRFFNYPLRPLNALWGLGLWRAGLILLSYAWSQLFPHAREDTFEQWVSNRFGRRLYETFFKTYTEKVWGIPCSELRAEWAAQRIRNLSLKTAVFSMFVKPRRTIKSLIEEFDYPRFGPGMMWNAVAEEIRERQGVVRLDADVIALRRTGMHIDGVVVSTGGREEFFQASHVISTMPVSELVRKLSPPAPESVCRAASRLSYRDFLTVCLIVNRPHLFPDNWIYVHSPDVKVGRIQNFKNWSPDMVPDSARTSLGLEYFCNEGDALWTMPDRELVELGKRELDQIGLASAVDVDDGCVFRVPKAYPIYDAGYRDALETVRQFVDGLDNLQTIGRNGLHRYNNQDHAMLTGLKAVRNLTQGERTDLWAVNVGGDYHEEVQDLSEQDLTDLEAGFARIFRRLDGIALGGAVGLVTGVLVWLATAILVLKGGDVVGPRLQLLAQYFPGYTVTWSGSLVGLAYGSGLGFLIGWYFASIRNTVFFLSMAIVWRRAQLRLLRRFHEFI